MTSAYGPNGATRQDPRGRTAQLSQEAHNFNWLLDTFTANTASASMACRPTFTARTSAGSSSRGRASTASSG